MGCGCRGKTRAGARASSGAKIVGFDYVPPGGGEPIRFMTSMEALLEQRKRGGGTIYQVTSG